MPELELLPISALQHWSYCPRQCGLIGKADVVDLRQDGMPCPIECKHGRASKVKHGNGALQLAAQGICLEEMTGQTVREGALFYAGSERRVAVAVGAALCASVEQAVAATRAMLACGRLPMPVNNSRCRACSLVDICQPQALAGRDLQSRLRARLYEPDD